MARSSRAALLGCLLAAAPSAVARAQTEDPPPSPEPPPERRGLTQYGIGVAYAGIFPRSGSGTSRASEIGLLLETSRTFPLSDSVDFGVRFAWGLTAWERFPKWAQAGYDAGRWTTQAYEDVYGWTRKFGDDGTYDPNTHGLRLMGGFFAMAVLWLGYVASGLAYVTAVVSPTTWMEVDATANYNFGAPSPKADTPYLKGGVALLAFLHPEHGTLAGGMGPTFGGGVRLGSVHLGASATWSPGGLHGEARGGRTEVLFGGVTIGLQR